MTDRRSKSDDRRAATGEFENRQFYQMFKNLFLNSETADVHFICVTDNFPIERVPAHKLLLSVASDGFKSMFDKAENDQNEFELPATSAAAFKEFLQCFYMPKVRFTTENIAAVMQLAKNYGNDEILYLASLYIEHKLNTSNAIWGYSLALRLDRPKMKEYCEKKISDCTCDVLKSCSFLDCDRDILGQILQFNALNCDEYQLLMACMEWAIATAKRKNLDIAKIDNLRNELGDLKYEIRFRSVTMDQFSKFIGTFAGFFSADELEQIIQMIAMKEFTPEKFCNKVRDTSKTDDNAGQNGYDKNGIIECNRFQTFAGTRYYVRSVEKTRFQTNKTTALIGFDCGLVMSLGNGKTMLPAKVSISEGPSEESPIPKQLFNGTATLTSEVEAHIHFNTPITIKKDAKYEIKLKQLTTKDHFNQIVLKKEVELKDGTKIRFLLDGPGWDDSKFGLITKMYFKQI